MEPHDKRQNYSQNANRKHQGNYKGKNDDDLSNLLCQLKSINVIESIVIKKNCYFCFVATKKQTNYISTFCCSGNDISVLEIDVTYNLCDIWVTDSCCRNKRLISNTSGVYPVYLGPTLLHFTKDIQTFTQFALEIQACNPETRGIKKIGVDMEDAIYNGVKILFPEAQQLYCVRHLKQQDKMQILKMMDRKKCTKKEKMMAKKEIILDIYGQRKGTLYKYGLAESSDEADFCGKLNSLQQKWESRCKGFFNRFCGNCKPKFINPVICSAHNGSNVDGLFYQNNIKSQHSNEKVQQNFDKKSVETTIRNFKTLMQRQDDEPFTGQDLIGIYGFM